MTASPRCSAVVIGGGPAGSSCAKLLVQAGWDITLVESAIFPRIKVCGEFISPAATAELERLIPPDRLLSLGAKRVATFTLECGDLRLSVPLGEPAWAISRGLLDETLLGDATSAGVRVLAQSPVRSIQTHRDRVSVCLDRQILEADVVIHADGSGRFAPEGPVPNARGVIGRKCHLRVPLGLLQGVTIRACPAAYVGTIAVEGDLATVALVSKSELTARFAGDGDEMLKSLWPAFQHGWRCSEWKACPVSRGGPFKSTNPRHFRIGNAAAAVDPIGGEGIGLALWAASTLAKSLASWREFKPDVSTIAQFHLNKAYRRRLRTRAPACRIAAEALMRPSAVKALWPLLGSQRGLLGPWLTLTGKPTPHTAHP